jgi:hypothetical protein
MIPLTLLFTKEQLIKKYHGKFIDTYPHYDYKEKKTMFEVRGVKRTIHENYNPPEDLKE